MACQITRQPNGGERRRSLLADEAESAKSRPSAAGHGRRLPGAPIVNAAMLDPAAIVQILTHMRLQPPDSPAERLADLSAKGFPSDDAFPATKNRAAHRAIRRSLRHRVTRSIDGCADIHEPAIYPVMPSTTRVNARVLQYGPRLGLSTATLNPRTARPRRGRCRCRMAAD
jgi:hypothetical protein